MAQRQRARLITARTQDRNLLSVYPITSHRCIKALEHPLNRHGAAEARGAHNSEDIRSKRIAGIQPITSHRCIKALEHQSPVAQRKRAVKHRQLPTRFEKIRQTDGYRLMSRRTHDRNVSGEYHITSHRCIKALEQNITGLV